MLGFLQGLNQSVAREGAARRAHQGQTLQRKENHLDRLLQQIRYNREMKRLQDRDARQDFVTDRAYDRGVLESDRDYGLRQSAENRAAELHPLTKQGMEMQNTLTQSKIEEWDLNEANRNLQRKHDAAILSYDMGLGLDTRRKQDALTREQYTDYLKDAPLRMLQRRYGQKLGEHRLSEGYWDHIDEMQRLEREKIEAEINRLNRPASSTSKLPAPTWSQTQEITTESLAPGVLQYLEQEGEHLVPPWHKDFQWQWFGFESDRPYVSTDPNEVTQSMLLRQSGGHLARELIARGVDPQVAMQMIPDYWDRILDTEGSDVLKRLKRTLGAAYDDLELREKLRREVYQGAWNWRQTGDYNKHTPMPGAGTGADALLNTPIQ